jgi:hypothetical protein
MNETSGRDVELLRWIEVNWSYFDRSEAVRAAAMARISPPPSREELKYLVREWFVRREEQDAASVGAPDAAEGASSGEGGVPSPPAGVDPETGELYPGDVPGSEPGVSVAEALAREAEDEEEDIPFVVDDTDDEAGDGPQEPPGGELVPTGELVSLYGRGGPEAALGTLERYADAIKQFVVEHDLTLEMEDGTRYVLSTGWEADGQLHGVFTEIEWTQEIADGWKARAYAHRPATGERWTSREAVATRKEQGKRYKPDTDLIGLAQTRAARNALKAALSITITAAGFDAAPPEERRHSPKQRAMLFALFAQLEQVRPRGKVTGDTGRQEDGWKVWATKGTLATYGKRISELNRQEMGWTIDRVQQVYDDLSSNGGGGDPGEASFPTAGATEVA